MSALVNFPLPSENQVTICEVESQLVTSIKYDASSIACIIGNYPTVQVSQDMVRQLSMRESVAEAFLPPENPSWPQQIRDWYYAGIIVSLEEYSQTPGEAGSVHLFKCLAGKLAKIGRCFMSVVTLLYPYSMVPMITAVEEWSVSRDWKSGIIRCIAWHPHCLKLAVCLIDDSIKIYTGNNPNVHTLKHRSQTLVSCLAWKYYSSSMLAVGCKVGIILWSVDSGSLVSRPSSTNMTLLSYPGHAPVTSLSWNSLGDLLLSASPKDNAIIVWNVSMETGTPVRRMGDVGYTFASWSPDGNHVFAASPSNTFRVWETEEWTSEKWTTDIWPVKTGCWSPCGKEILFTTTKDPIIYHLTFSETGCHESKIGSASNVLPVVDLTEISVPYGIHGDIKVGGCVHSMRWDPSGQRLAVMFRTTNLLAVFRTQLSPSLMVIPWGWIQGPGLEYPLMQTFQPHFSYGALLTVVWSGGSVQHIPFLFLEKSSPSPSGHLNLFNDLVLKVSQASLMSRVL